MDFAGYFIENNLKVAWFNFETTQAEILERFERKGNGLPIFYLPREMKNSFKWFRSKIREAILKYDIKVVFIDY